MSDLSDLLNVTRRTLGLNEAQTRLLGNNIQKECSGQLYINKPIEQRNKEIRSAFNGINIQELSRQYGLTDRMIREIVR